MTFVNCPDHAYGGVLPCPWPDCAQGVTGDTITDSLFGSHAVVAQRRQLPGPDGTPRYFWNAPVFPLLLAVGNLVRSEHQRRVGPHPERLYHYTSLEGLKGIITSGTLWMTDYSYLNDAREFYLGIDRATDVLTRAAEDPLYAALHGVLRDLLQDLQGMPAERVLLTCFCAKADSLSHWDRYTKSGVGVAIGMRTSGLFASLGYPRQTDAGKVIYDPVRQEEFLHDLLHFASLAIAEDAVHPKHNPTFYRELLQRHLYELLVLFKDEGFADEREYRFAYVGNTNLHRLGLEPAPLEFRIANHLIVPYTKMCDLAKIKPSRLPIEEVIVSPHADAGSIARGVVEFLKHHEYEDARVRPSALRLR